MEEKSPKKSEIYSYNTAISRSAASAPVRYLESNSLISGSVLDYGSGKGADARYLSNLGYSVSEYDPYWNRTDALSKTYDTILCSYVLNVLKEEDEKGVVDTIVSLLSEGGTAYIAVRRDIKKDGITTRGFQRNVTLNEERIFQKSGSFAIYKIKK